MPQKGDNPIEGIPDSSADERRQEHLGPIRMNMDHPVLNRNRCGGLSGVQSRTDGTQQPGSRAQRAGGPSNPGCSSRGILTGWYPTRAAATSGASRWTSRRESVR